MPVSPTCLAVTFFNPYIKKEDLRLVTFVPLLKIKQICFTAVPGTGEVFPPML